MNARPSAGTRVARPIRILLLEMARDGTIGGSHHCLRNIALALRDRRLCPVVCFLEESAFRRRLESEGVETHVFAPPESAANEPVGRSAPARAWRFFASRVRAARRIRRRLREWDVDILHQNNTIGLGEEWIFAARAARLPVVVHQRGFFLGNLANRWLTDGRIHRVVCISRAVERELLHATRIPSSRVVQIWDFVDTRIFSPLSPAERAEARAALGADPDRLLIGMVGNIKEWKGQHIVLQALARLPLPTRDQIRCLFMGAVSSRPEDRSYFERLQGLVDEAGLDSTVAFGGFRGDMNRLYPALDVLVHASVDPEPFGMVLAEAMSCGVPVVASRGGGPEEIVVEGETGWLVDRGDANGLAARLEDLVQRRHVLSQVGDKARARAVRHFSPGDATDRLVDLYSSLLGREIF